MSSLTRRLALGFAILAALLLLSPFLFMAFLMGNNFIGALLSPTRDAAWSEPTPGALAGTYVSLATTLTLRADHTFTVNGLPSSNLGDEKSTCDWNGTGRWTISRLNQLSLDFIVSTISRGTVECARKFPPNRFTVLGQQPPYRLYLTFGDPDSSDGIELLEVEIRKPMPTGQFRPKMLLQTQS